MPNAIRLTVCDNCPAIRLGLQQIISAEPDIITIIQATSHEEILGQYIDRDMDILVMDLEQDQDQESGLENLSRIRKLRPDVKIIVFTSCRDKSVIMRAVELGVQGFHLKQASPREIINAILTVHKGGTSLAPCVTEALLEHMQSKQTRSDSMLSNREQEVLDLLAKGSSNNDIARKLFITTRTVKYHVSSIFTKLNVKNRTEAAAKWVH